MQINQSIDDAAEEVVREALKEFMQLFVRPAFGSIPKREIELAVFQILRRLSAVDENASLYDLMTDLRITRSKASQLLFDIEVRKLGDDVSPLDIQIEDTLINTRFAKDGDYFVLEIENPLLNAHLKEKIRRLNHISDTSFNSAIIRMPLDAVTDLMTSLVDDERLETVRLALIAAGAPDTSIKGVLLAATKKLGSKVLGNVADDLVDDASSFLTPIFRGALDGITGQWREVFREQEE